MEVRCVGNSCRPAASMLLLLYHVPASCLAPQCRFSQAIIAFFLSAGLEWLLSLKHLLLLGGL